MQSIDGFDFFAIEFDKDGTLTSKAEFDALLERAGRASDLVYIAHGFRNDANDAHILYTKFMKTLRANLGRSEFSAVNARAIVIAGIFWPSKPFRESFDESADDQSRALVNPEEERRHLAVRLERLKADTDPAHRHHIDQAIALLPTLEGHPNHQDEFVAHVMAVVPNHREDDGDGASLVRHRPGSETLARLQTPNVQTRAIDRRTETRGLGDIAGNIAGAVGQFLNLTTWYVMKERSGTVGATGVADAVRKVAKSAPHLKTHLVGHSLGGRLMASCAKALCATPAFHPDSLMLLEAAFSHYGFSKDNGHGTRGFFRDVIDQQIVKGPFLSTFSAQDTVVGKAYSIMSRLAKDSSREIGDAHDEFGGIGRNGPLNVSEILTEKMHTPGTPYGFKLRVINNLDGSGGFVKDHSDVTNEAVTYAFASALSLT